MVSSVEMIGSPLVICGKVEYSASPNARPPLPSPGDLVTVTRIDRSTFDLFAIVKQIVDAKAISRLTA